MSWLSSKWFKIGVSLSLLTYLISLVDLAQLASHLRSMHLPLFALVFSGYLLGQCLSAYKWRLLARPLGFSPSQKTATVYYFAGMYLNLFAPSTVLGDLGRGFLLAGPEGKKGLALHSVIADRASGLATLLWIGALALLLSPSYSLPPPLYYLTLLGAGGSLLAWWLIPRLASLLLLPQNRLRILIENDLAPYWYHQALLLKVLGLSVCFHIFQIGLQYLLSRSLHLSIPPGYFFLFFPLVTLLSALPLSFSGIGVREGGYVFFLKIVGIEKEQALAMGLLWTGVVMGAGLIGGLVLILSPQPFLRAKETQKE